MNTQRFFNTAGPVRPEEHYCLSPLERINLDEIMMLIDQKKYFVLHAPRQTGKTSALHALRDHLNKSGNYRCLYINVEAAQAARENVPQGMQAILYEISQSAKTFLNDSYPDTNMDEILKRAGGFNALNALLSGWSENNSTPLVLLIDEIDSLVGDTLISVLRQLRSGYNKRPTSFPQSIVLCGVRDVREYRIHSAMEQAIITGGSCFNIKAESLRLGDFSSEDVKDLLLQHTNETGQPFEESAIQKVWELTAGQPWLVNALAYEVTYKMAENRDRSKAITPQMIEQAKENIILRRETHIDQLVDKLSEPRVQSVMESILVCKTDNKQISPDDLQYVSDLGLIKIEGEIKIANRIYQEVIPRELIFTTQVRISQDTSWYIKTSGQLNMEKLLTAFQQFFREHSEHWIENLQYKEAGPQLLLQAFLQRIVNGGGRVEREYGLGRMRTDLLLIWPYEAGVQKTVIELKILYDSLAKTIADGLDKTIKYMDKCGTDDGHLVVFNRSEGKSWEEKIFRKEEKVNGKKIVVWGM